MNLTEEQQELRRKYWRMYYAENAERICEYRKQYYAKNAERIRARKKEIRDADPDRFETYRQHAIERKLGALTDGKK